MRRCTPHLANLIILLLLTTLLYACGEKSTTPSAPPSATPAGTSGSATVTPQPTAGSGATAVAPVVHTPAAVKPFLQAGMKARLVEEQTEALPLWREFRYDRPTLLVFSAKTINAIPETVAAEVARTLATATDAEIVRRTARPSAETLLAADMGITAALRAGYFSRVIWVAPTDETAGLSFASFMTQFRAAAGGWGRQLDSFQPAGKNISGELEGVPIDIVTLDSLPAVTGPTIVHIDSGFFKGYYRNEIKTPFYLTVVGLLKKVAAKGYKTVAVSVSQDNLMGEISIATRFLGRDLAMIIADPTILEKPVRRLLVRGDLLYLNNFFKLDLQHEKARELVALDKSDAGAQYALYEVLRGMKQDQEAFAALARAVQLDPVYLIEYLLLAEGAVEGKQPEAGLAFINKAVRAAPQNPFLRLRKVDLLLTLKRGAEALPLLEELKREPWSSTYYPNMSEEIDGLIGIARYNEGK